MIETKDLLSTSFYEKSPFFGSCDNLCFKLEKKDDLFLLTTWKGPFSFDKTKEIKTKNTFPFSNDSLDEICKNIISISKTI